MEKSVELSNRSSASIALLGDAYAIKGMRSEALAILKELEDKYAKHEATGKDIASVYAGLGDKEQTFAWPGKALQDRSALLPRITWYPPFASLRDDPRFKDIVRRMGLAE